jgi:hypothetical protein
MNIMSYRMSQAEAEIPQPSSLAASDISFSTYLEPEPMAEASVLVVISSVYPAM